MGKCKGCNKKLSFLEGYIKDNDTYCKECFEKLTSFEEKEDEQFESKNIIKEDENKQKEKISPEIKRIIKEQRNNQKVQLVKIYLMGKWTFVLGFGLSFAVIITLFNTLFNNLILDQPFDGLVFLVLYFLSFVAGILLGLYFWNNVKKEIKCNN